MHKKKSLSTPPDPLAVREEGREKKKRGGDFGILPHLNFLATPLIPQW